MSSLRNCSNPHSIDVRDEKEFKLWIKLIASIHKEGGDISKPIDIIWRSVKEEIKASERNLQRI